jgi:spermidine synthase
MFPATFALGGIFPVALQYCAPGLDQVAESVGAVYAANTAGTIIGAASTGFLIVPLVGVRNTLVMVAVLEVILGLVALAALVAPSGRARWFLAVPMAAAAVLMPVVRPGWDTRLMNSGVYISLWELPEGATWEDFASRLFNNNRILYHAEGLTASVMVAEQPKLNNVYLAVNGKVEASTAGDMETQLVCGHLPILLHENARDVLVIGLASGITAGAVASHPVD